MDACIKDLTDEQIHHALVIEAQNGFPWNLELFEDSINRGHNCRALFVDGKLVSYLIADIQGDTAYPVKFATSKAYRRLGLGERLLEDLIVHCKSKEVKRLKIHISPSNHAALRFNHKHGYQKVGTHKNYYGKEDALICVKEL